MAFSHEVVPDYLRTKPEPEVEERVQMLSVKASSITQEATQVTYKKAVIRIHLSITLRNIS